MNILNLNRLLTEEVWKTLPYPDIIKLGQASKQYTKILESPDTWIYLLKRDYDSTWDHNKHNPRDYYEVRYWLGLDEEGEDQPTPNSDSWILSKWQQYIDSQPKHQVTYLALEANRISDCILGKVSGVNYSDVIRKVFINIELDLVAQRMKRPKETITEYFVSIYSDNFLNDDFYSITDVFRYLEHYYHEEYYSHDGNLSVRRLDTLHEY